MTNTMVTVDLAERSYNVRIVNGCAEDFPGVFRGKLGNVSCAIVTNTTLAALYKGTLAQWQDALGASVCVIDDGEEYKTIATWEKVLGALLAAKLDRRAAVIAFGGGVVGDIAGFAAASYLRGVDFVQIPTTLLAMVDSSVGGKTGVNHAMGKNLIGAFHQPRLVWLDMAFLATLPRREYTSGYAELFKTAFFGGRAAFDFVCAQHGAMSDGPGVALAEGIERSVRIKADIVSRDEHESGVRAVLNFGHTFAHAFERTFGYKGLMHGEAVWWGMKCACELGRIVKSIPSGAADDYARITSLMQLCSLPFKPEPAALYDAMATDKKSVAGNLRFILPAAPGEAVVRGDVPREQVLEAIALVLG